MSRIVILYSELADYSVACFKEITKHDVELLLIHWPANPEAPFQFDLTFCESISKKNIDRNELKEKVVEFNPALILVSGWMDKDYVNISKSWFGEVPTILSLDNHWTGSIKQRIAAFVSPFTLLRNFSHAFVPGQIQFNYARRLGFSITNIQTGFYSCDNQKFNEIEKQISLERREIPKRFIYLGRYVKHKGIFDLWDAFIEFQKKHSEWELWCIGTGDQYDNRIESKGIKHFGFLQPSELLPILKECSVCILPSHFEPWGVSVQEMAIAGFPLLLSDKIGSREVFLNEGINGFTFEAGNSGELQAKMERISQLGDQQLDEMRIESRKLGLTNSPSLWSTRLLSFLKED